jgi:hypothetical protein
MPEQPCGDVFDPRLPDVICDRKPKHTGRHQQRHAMSGRVHLQWWDLPRGAGCPHGDPACPCQDGDVCHYVDDPATGTKAMQPPDGAATP